MRGISLLRVLSDDHLAVEDARRIVIENALEELKAGAVGHRMIDHRKVVVMLFARADVQPVQTSGRPLPFEHQIDAGAGILVNLPRWIPMDADGKPFDAIGIMPDVFIDTVAGAFSDKQDPVLSAALKHLRKSEKPAGGVLKVRRGAERPERTSKSDDSSVQSKKGAQP